MLVVLSRMVARFGGLHVALLLVACAEPVEGASAGSRPAKPAPAAEVPRPVEAAPAKPAVVKPEVAKPTVDAPPTDGLAEGKIGVPECDEYIEKYGACLDEKVPANARPHMKQAMELAAKAWRQAASGPAKDGVAATCRSALGAAKQATESLGCDW